MIKKIVGLWGLLLIVYNAHAQVDTTFIYKTGTPFGTLDLRIAKSSTRYYFLEEGKTFSFRESSPGVKTNTYRDMTSWDSSPYTQGNLREKNGSTNSFIMNYRLLFPGAYNATVPEGYPLIVMVHGLGERANCWDNSCYWADRNWRPGTNTPAAPTSSSSELLNNDHNLLHGGSIHLQMRNAAGTKLPNDPTLPDRSFQGFVLFPQNLNGWDGNQAQDVIRIIRLLCKKYNIDQNRIYIHGLSNGGGYVYDIVKRAPWMFSAAAPMSAVNDGGITTQNLTSSVSSVPFWIFQGALDGNPTPGKTEGYIKKFKEAGLTIRYTKYANIGHGVWNNAYNEPDFFTWLRSKHKSQLHVYADNPTLCTTTGQGVRMDLAEGFLAYQWERDGGIIPGATSASYTATTTGTYRARFSRKSATPSESEWNQWSQPVTVVSSSPAPARMEQTGTVVLKDLNYYNYAHLYSVDQADHYYWYRDGSLVDLSGSADDTVRYVRLSAGDCSSGTCAGNGTYTLVTAGFNNCPSPPSEPKQIFFGDQAPVNITAPSSFTGNATSATTASIQWADASSNEGGFEIWRRKQTGTSTFSKWQMATLTGPNVTSFNDGGLEPSSTYQYKIRCVSSTGRSNYTPSASNQFLVIVTQGDSQLPTVPQNLTAAATAIGEITLSWQASTDNTGIREYVVNYGSQSVNTGSAGTTFKLTGLPINTTYSITVQARDLGNNLSAASNTAAADTYTTGLYYEHSTGAWSDLDAIDWNIAEFKGKVNNFTLAPRTQEDYFNFEFEGYIYINTAGSYTFETASDDGSRLTIDNTVAVENDGLHGTVTVTSAPITLSSGPHKINVKYFEYEGGISLTVRYRGADTGNSMIVIPDAALKSGNRPAPMAAREAGDDAEQIDVDPAIDAWPNPMRMSDELTVQLNDGGAEPVMIKIFSFNGKAYYNKAFTAAEAAEGILIEPDKRMHPGLYVITVQQNDRVTRKLIMVKN